jgi:hypothetical protein
MILEWLAPAAAMAFSGRLLWLGRKLEWTVGNLLKTAGTLVLSCVLIRTTLGIHAFGEIVVLSAILLTMTFIPGRTVFRLIGAKRPNEVEDPGLFENGELKPDGEIKRLSEGKQD